MATALEATSSKEFSKQFSQLSISTVESVEETEIDAIVNKRWTFNEVADLLEKQIAILPGGRDKNGGSIIVIQGTEGQIYWVASMAKILSYLGKIPDESVQGQGFTIILDMRRATWSQMKKCLESLRLTFVEHIHQVIIMKPKSLWQRGRSAMNFNMKKSKYKYKCILLEHSADIFHHLSPAHVPKAQNGQLDYDHAQWMEIQKTIENYLIQFFARRDNYHLLQEILEKSDTISTLEEARDAVKYHLGLREELDRSGLDNMCAAVCHSIARLRPNTTNPDFEASFIRLEELGGTLQNELAKLEELWEKKGETLDRILQFKTFENDAEQHLLWLRDQMHYLSRELTKIGTSSSLALSSRQQVEEYQTLVNSKHPEINRVLEVGERLVSLNHPSSDMIHKQSEIISEKWEGLTDMVEERVALMVLSFNFHEKQDQFFNQSEIWTEEFSSQFSPPDIRSTEDAIEKHRQLKDAYSDLYVNARQDGHALIEKLRRPIGEGSVPPDFVLATRHIKEILENLYDEKNLIDEQWKVRQDHLSKTLNFRIFQKDTGKILSWITDVGNPFLSGGGTIGVDINSAQMLLKNHDSFESDSEVPVVYSRCNLLQSRAKELVSNKECRQDEIEGEALKLEETINNFATRLDDRREVIVLAIECFKASDNFLGEIKNLSMSIPQSRFEGDVTELDDRLGRYRTRHDILKKVAMTTLKLWESLRQRLKSSTELGIVSGCTMNYAIGLRTSEEKVREVETEKDKMEELSQQRIKRWELSLERHALVKKIEENLLQLDSWLQESVGTKVDLADNVNDAQLQLDIFERQYYQQKDSQELLIARGQDISNLIDQLDRDMFGHTMRDIKVRETLEKMVSKMEEGKAKMTSEAGPRLTLLEECVQYHLLEQRSHKLNVRLNQISASLSRLVGVGHNLEEAHSLDQNVRAVEEKLEASNQDVNLFSMSIAECLDKKHYQSSSLSVLNRSLTEKVALVKRNLTERQKVVHSALEFHSNYDKLQSTMEYCQTQFSSRDSGHTLIDIEHQQSTMKELKESLNDTVEVVKSQAEQLVSILRGPGQTEAGRKSSNEDILGDRTPRLLVIPKKAHQDKPQASALSSQPDQLVIEGLVNKMEARISRLNRLWENRHTRLEQSKQVIEFEQEVPKVLKWLDETGVVFLENRHDYGRSLEEVNQLLHECTTFQRDVTMPITDKVEELKNLMKQFEETGHYELNRIRSIGSHLEQRWDRFESDMKTRLSNLKLSLSFQENLFEGSNWCMQSEQFLHSLDDKINQCDTSEEASSLSAELSIYLSVTKDEQMERVSKIQQISSFLHSNPLVELAGQLEQSTNVMLKDIDSVKHDLETLHSKLVQIEKEKDREMRLLKQKERVVEELISTEEVYVNDLKLVVETFKPRFISEFLPESLKGKETIVFGNIQWIAEFHIEVLWPRLQQCDGDADEIAKAFIDNVEIMTDLYVPYCQNKTQSEELLASHRSYLNRVSSLFGNDTPLSSLLIKPIQRITKYPLLLKDCLKYATQLGQPIEVLQLAVQAVEEIPVQTNNAIHLSLLKSEEGLKWHKYGELLYQGSLLVSEPRLLITSEKERQVFVFENTVVFARRIELGQAKFHYEYKFRIPLTAGVQVIEFIEGEPSKFALFTSDHRMHLKASSVDVKHEWVKALRTAIHKHIEEEANKLRSLSVSSARIRSNALQISDVVAKDLTEKHPKSHYSPLLPRRPSSPFSTSRINLPLVERTSMSPPPVSFDLYKVKEDYVPLKEDQHGLSLKKEQRVEVMEQLETGRWFIRATTITGQVEHGWVPSSILELLPPPSNDEDEEDGPSFSQDELGSDNRTRRYTAALDNYDISHQIISTLRKVTIGESSSPLASKRTVPVTEELPQTSTLDKSPLLSRQSVSPQPPKSPQMSTITEVTLEESEDMQRSPASARFRRRGVVRKRSSVNRSSAGSFGSMQHDSSSEDETNPLAPPSPVLVHAPPSPPIVNEEEERIKKEKAVEKMRYIMAELLETEKEYISKLDTLVNGFLKNVQDSDKLPELLQGKERMIFGNVAAIYEFHRDVFQDLLEKSKGSPESIAQCFLDKHSDFKLYVTYCENKPKSESFVWTYAHQGGTYFKEIQTKLKVREDIASFLIKPVQRITKYQLLLKDLVKSSQKAGQDVPLLEEALQLMQDVPKQANDAMALSMIVGYHGNIHANGQIILQDEFTVYEKSRWAGGARRHVFLLDLLMIITKDKDNDGLYVFKDSLKVHNMTLTEKEADNPNRFAIGTGQIGDWDKYYIFEAPTSEKKQEWVRTIKDILNQQFEMLKALKQPTTARVRSSTVDTLSYSPNSSPKPILRIQTNALQDMSDSSLDEESEEEEEPITPITRKRSSAIGIEDSDFKKIHPFVKANSEPRSVKLYIAGDDCPPSAKGQRIFYLRKGQIYNVLDSTGDWWLARLIREIPPGDIAPGAEGWVPCTFMDPFVGQLTKEEEEYLKPSEKKSGPVNKFSTLPAKIGSNSSSVGSSMTTQRLSLFPNFSKSEEKRKNSKGHLKHKPNALRFTLGLCDETVLCGRGVQFKCELDEEYPNQKVEWFHNGESIKSIRAFISNGGTCVLKIKDVIPEDEGLYICMVSAQGSNISTSAKLTVLGPPNPPSQPDIKQITSTSVSLSWAPPTFDGHSPITIYLVECKDTLGNRWSTLMKRITEPSTIVDDLVPGTEYVFRVIAGNHIGSSQPSEESDPVRMIRHTMLQPVFSLEPFHNHYTLMDQIAKGRFSTIYECLHEATQQSYVAKLLPIAVGQDHAHHELTMLTKLFHPNIVQMTSSYLTDEHYIIVMQYIRGVPVYEYFTHNKTSNEKAITRCCHQLTSGLQYLHGQNIAHLSVKPHHVMITESLSGVMELRLIHLAAAQVVSKDLFVSSSGDYLEYEGPEILLKESVSMATDMWAVGVLMFTLLSGSPPFVVDSLDLTKENIKHVRLSFPSRQFKSISNDAKDMISQLLQRQTSSRLTSTQCLQHNWLQKLLKNNKSTGATIDMSRLKEHLRHKSPSTR